MGFFDKTNVKSLEALFDKITDVKKFASNMINIKGSVTITNEQNYICDGKSILGIFGLNLSNPVTITCHTDEFPKLYDVCDSLGIIVHSKITEGNDS